MVDDPVIPQDRSYYPYPENWGTIRKQIKRRDNYGCQLCGAKGSPESDIELHVHHIIPKSDGGSHFEENLLTLCWYCHNEQHYATISRNKPQKLPGGWGPNAGDRIPNNRGQMWPIETYREGDVVRQFHSESDQKEDTKTVENNIEATVSDDSNSGEAIIGLIFLIVIISISDIGLAYVVRIVLPSWDHYSIIMYLIEIVMDNL